MLERLLIFLLSFLLFLNIQCSNSESENRKSPVIFCAASLTGYIDEFKDTLKSNKLTPVLNIASSGTLARQLTQGVKADIFLSANYRWGSYVDSLGLVDSIIPFAKNRLVCIAPFGKEYEADLNYSEMNRIAIGNPAHVPAGEYTKELLLNMGQYNALKEKFIFTKDVKSALRLVEMKECDAGFVYKSDALSSNKVQIISNPPDSLYSEVVVYLIKLKSGDQTIFNELLSLESRRILKKHGFEPL
jgi:molybdate transport system substrate-binding protein